MRGKRALTADQRQHRGLQPGKAHVEVAAVLHRPRQYDRARSSRLGKLRQLGTAWVTEAEESGGLVERFSGGIVEGISEQRVIADCRHRVELRVPPGNQQRDEGEARLRVAEQRRQQMSLEMVDRERRLAQRVSECRCHACANQQGPREARPLCVGNTVEVGEDLSRFDQQILHQRHHPTDMVA